MLKNIKKYFYFKEFVFGGILLSLFRIKDKYLMTLIVILLGFFYVLLMKMKLITEWKEIPIPLVFGYIIVFNKFLDFIIKFWSVTK